MSKTIVAPSPMQKILLCEDDLNLGVVIKKYFELHNFQIVMERDGKLGLAAFKKHEFSLCLVDVMMPKMDGFELVKEIRRISKVVPIMFITAKSLKQDQLKGYDVGANDYIVKPFDIDVLMAKVQSMLQQKNAMGDGYQLKDGDKLSIGSYSFNTKIRELIHKKESFFLSPTEGKLLTLLYKYKDVCLPRELALKEIWGDDSHYNGRSMDVYITRLRKYFIHDEKIQINNIHSTGFQLLFPTKK